MRKKNKPPRPATHRQRAARKNAPVRDESKRTASAPKASPGAGSEASPPAEASAPGPEAPAAGLDELAPAGLTSPGDGKMRSYAQQAYSLLTGRYPGLIDDALSRSIVGVFEFGSTGSGSVAVPAEFAGLNPILVHVSIRRIPGPSFPVDGVTCEAQFDDDNRTIDVNVSPSTLMYTGFALFQKGDAA